MVLGRQDCLWGGPREGLGPGWGVGGAGLETALCVLPTWDNCEHPTVAQHPRAAKESCVRFQWSAGWGLVKDICTFWFPGRVLVMVEFDSGHFSSHFPGHDAE